MVVVPTGWGMTMTWVESTGQPCVFDAACGDEYTNGILVGIDSNEIMKGCYGNGGVP